MDRSQKEDLVLRMRENLQEAAVVIVTRQVGLTVAEATNLRRAMRQNQAEYRVLKNTLAQIAVRGTHLEGISNMFEGPTAVAYSKDPLAAAKAVVTFAKGNDKLEIVGAFMDGQVLNAASVQALATLPSLDELRSKLLAIISAPATKLAILLKEPAGRIARVLSAKGA